MISPLRDAAVSAPTVSTSKRPVSKRRRPLSTSRRPVSKRRRPLSTSRRPVSKRRRPLSTSKRPVSKRGRTLSMNKRPLSKLGRASSKGRRPVSLERTTKLRTDTPPPICPLRGCCARGGRVGVGVHTQGFFGYACNETECLLAGKITISFAHFLLKVQHETRRTQSPQCQPVEKRG
jgi:hypothetical protein